MPENNDQKILVDAAVKLNNTMTKAFLRLHVNDDGKPLEAEMINELIKQAGITYGLNYDTLNNLVKHPVFERDIEIASGKDPINGEDGRINYIITDNSVIPKLLPDGKVDYHDLGSVINVKKGDIIAKIILPKNGINGINVLGKEIKAKDGKPVIPPLGKNVVSNGQEIISDIDGQFVWVNGKINVFQVFEVKGDVDYSVGNIDFIGSVHIHGNVNMGFKIKAKGDIIVDGLMDSSELLCEGNILIRKGVQGEGKGLIKCTGNLTTKYIENCSIEVGGSIYCEAILYSKVMCDNGIYVSGKRGVIINSIIKAKNEIIANSIGSPMYARTEIEVGFDPEIKTQVTNIKNNIEHLNEELLKISKIINYFRQTLADKNDPNRKSIYEKSLLTQQNIEKQLIEYNETLIKLNSKMNISDNAKIRVNETLYQGVKITIGSSTVFIHQDYHHILIKEENAQIVFLPI